MSHSAERTPNMHVPPQIKTSVYIRHTIFHSAKLSVWQEDFKKHFLYKTTYQKQFTLSCE